jgi:hypothetical protein
MKIIAGALVAFLFGNVLLSTGAEARCCGTPTTIADTGIMD